MSNTKEGSKSFGYNFKPLETSALETPETRAEYKLSFYLKEIPSILEQSNVPEDKEMANNIRTRLSAVKADLIKKLGEWSAFTEKHEGRLATIKDLTSYSPINPEMKHKISKREVVTPQRISGAIDIGLSLKMDHPENIFYYSQMGYIDEQVTTEIPKTNSFGRNNMPRGRFGIFEGEISPETRKKIISLLGGPENLEYKPETNNTQPTKESFAFQVQEVPKAIIHGNKGHLESTENKITNFEILKLTIDTEFLAKILLDNK